MRIIFLSLLISSTSWAQGLTFQQAIAEAQANNPEIERLAAVANRESWGKLNALSTYIPHLSVAADHYFDAEYMRQNILFGGSTVNFPAGYPQTMVTLEAEMTLFDGLAGWNQYQAASLTSEAANLELRRARMALESAVRNAFFQALAAQKFSEVANQNVKTLEDHLARAQVTERSGYGTRFDVLRIQANLEGARAERESAENNVHAKRDELTELLGKDSRDDRPLLGELPVFKNDDIAEKIELNLQQRDDLQAQFKREEAAGRLRSASRGVWFPKISVFANEQYYKFGDFDPAIQPNSDYQNAWAMGLRLSWNLFDGGRSYSQQRIAAENALVQKAEVRKALARLPNDLDIWKRKFTYSVSLYKARLRALNQFEESVRLAQVGLRSGVRTHSEALDAELDLFRARGQLVQAQADAIEALGHLELAVGQKLWSGN